MSERAGGTAPSTFKAKVRAFIDGWNDRAQPFLWTKTADQILTKANRPTAENPQN